MAHSSQICAAQFGSLLAAVRELRSPADDFNGGAHVSVVIPGTPSGTTEHAASRLAALLSTAVIDHNEVFLIKDI